MWPFTGSYPEKSAGEVNGNVYDYVIVGGGTSGCVLASLLSEDPTISVLVIDRGAVNDTWSSRVPLISMDFVGRPGAAVIDRWSVGLPARGGYKLQLVSADAIGGSSRINATLVTRGAPGGYNDWADNLGLTEWSWAKVEPYFKSLESAASSPNDEHRGHNGRFSSRQLPEVHEWPSHLEKPCRSLGLDSISDANTPTAPAQALFTNEFAIDHQGKRVSTFSAFLNKDVVSRRKSHLTICTRTIVTRLKSTKDIASKNTVQGVYLRQLGQGTKNDSSEYFVSARREVVIYSGALSTPQLLLLSGIGPEEELAGHGIAQVSDLPAVGKNLQDHAFFPIFLEVTWSESVLAMTRVLSGLWNFLLYIFLGTGIMGTGLTPRSVFLRSSTLTDQLGVKKVDEYGRNTMDAHQPHNVPDIEVMLVAASALDRWLKGKSIISFLTTLVQPNSTGSLQLASTNPKDYPTIHYPYLEDAKDLETARKATRFSMRLATELIENPEYKHPISLFIAPTINKEMRPTKADTKGKDFSDATAFTVFPENRSGEKTWDTVTDEEIDEYLKAVGSTGMHYSSTCRMSLDPKLGVVDQKLVVHGFRNLRIADASVFPKLPSSHTMLPVMMLAARCADFMKADWEKSDV